MTESLIFPPVAPSHKRLRVNLGAIPARTTHDFTPAGIGLALFVCCSNSLLYTRICLTLRVVQCLGFKLPLFMTSICFRP